MQDYKKNFLGNWLVKEKIVTDDQLQEALNYQADKSGGKGMLGKNLVQMGYCTEEDIARIIAKRAGVPFVSLEKYLVDRSALALLTPEVIKRYKALPIDFKDGKLVMAMQQPTDIMAIDDLRILTGYDIKAVFATDSELDAAIEKYSLGNIDFQQVDDEAEQEDEKQQEQTIAGLEDSEESPAVQLANMIISQAVNARASDVHIEPYEKNTRVRFRIDGVLHDMMEPPKRLHASLVSRIKVMANMDIADRRVPQDGRTSVKMEGRTIDLRIASLPTSYGERLTLRLLDRSNEVINLEQLGVAPDMLKNYRQAVDLPYGFILVTGPTGSGKSTTLYASLAALDKVEKNVITVEDPVEYRIDQINQVQINSRAGLTFASGLRSILRNDPDIVMVGEIRDKETAKIAVESAMTGHLVFSTLHTNDAASTVTRLTEMGIEPFLITSSLACVLAQRLARVLCPKCKEPYELSGRELENIKDFPFENGETSVTVYRPKGCIRCSNTGYKGRVGIYELLKVSEKIQKMILEKRSSKEIRTVAVEEGMTTLLHDGLNKVKQGITSLEEVMRVVV
ncbi:MAG: type II secretion system protein GspE [Firmicutes bacterium]|nr:type II secretion system protein GspE [Bacillota bacterium]